MLNPGPAPGAAPGTCCPIANTDAEAWPAGSQAGIPGRGPALPTRTQPTGTLPSSWPFWIPRTQLPEHPHPQQPTPPHPQTSPRVWGSARAWRHVSSGTKRFFSSQDRFHPASPTSHGARGTYKGKPPRERNPKLQRARPSREGRLGTGMGRKPRHVGPGALIPPPPH